MATYLGAEPIFSEDTVWYIHALLLDETVELNIVRTVIGGSSILRSSESKSLAGETFNKYSDMGEAWIYR